MSNQNPLRSSLRLLLVSHLTCDTFLGFLAGGGLALTLSNRSLHGLTTAAEIGSKYVPLGRARHTLILCVALGFTVWARRFLFATPRYYATLFRTLSGKIYICILEILLTRKL